MSHLLKEKKYPQQYPEQAVRVLNAMTFTNGAGLKIMGSASLQSQSYAGDYDGYEIVEHKSPEQLVEKFKHIIEALWALPKTYIGDIKAGVVEEWRVLPKSATTFAGSEQKIEALLKGKIISPAEAAEAKQLVKKKPTKVNILKALQDLKFHIVRWTPDEIIAGSKKLRDGRTYTLKEAITSPTMTKVDVVSLVNGKYTEFSVIYEFHYDGRVLNPDYMDPEKTLSDSLKLYEAEGNRFKALKRRFALAKLHNDVPALAKYNKVLNSELGKIYVLYSVVKTIGDLL